MILDAKLILCDEDAITGITAETLVGDVLDLGASGKDAFGATKYDNLGAGGQVWLNVICQGTDFDDSGSPTMAFSLKTGSDEAITGDVSVLAVKNDVDKTPNDGDLIWSVAVPSAAFQRYVGIYVSADSAMDSGKISAWIGQAAETPLQPVNLKK